jgi:sec-independent protein translocase protein TatB
MFGIAWNEYIIIAIVALIVIGPKELPTVLRAIGQWTAKVRRMAAEFQGQFQEALREAEMADLKKEVDDLGAQAKGFASQFDDPMNFQEATKWEPKPEIKPEPAPALEADASGDAVKAATPSSGTVPAPEAGAEPSAPAAPAAGPTVSEHSTAGDTGAAPPSGESAPKADEKAGDGGVHA